MKINHTVSFDFELVLGQKDAIDFVRDVAKSLSRASFITELEVDETGHVSAKIPVNAALFGQQTLAFESDVLPTPQGAKLISRALETKAPGWAEVAGESVVRAVPSGSSVHYQFDIAIHLRLPKAEKWGGQALTRMIEFTAEKVLETVVADFPKAVQEAARAVEQEFAGA